MRLMLSVLLIAHAPLASAGALDSAKVLVASNRTLEAIPILEGLVATDPNNPDHCYFLGQCLVRQGQRISEAAILLQRAAARYASMDIDPGMGEPEFVQFYLVLAYSRMGECERGMQSYEEFVDIYSRGDPFYTTVAARWIELCNDPERLEAEAVTAFGPATSDRGAARDRLVPVSPDGQKVATRPKEFSTASVLFGVQVAALAQAKFAAHFPGLRNVAVYVDRDGIYRYVIGSFSLRSQAERLMAQVRAAGYPDAFIVDINSPERAEEEVVLLEGIGIQGRLSGQVEFRVQVGAFAEAMPDRIASYYLELEGLRSDRHGELTLLTYGAYATYAEARSARDGLAGKGHTDAFVTAFHNSTRIPLDLALRHAEQAAAQPAAEAQPRKHRRGRQP